MLVYRLETFDGIGAYTDTKGYQQIKHKETHVVPWWDRKRDNTGYLDFAMRHKCGFDSIAQLLEWFDAETVENLAGVGVGIAAYEVHPDFVQLGEYQCLFEYAYAERTSFDLTSAAKDRTNFLLAN